MEISEIISGNKKIVVIPHKSPDGDAISSCLALQMYLRKKGHEVSIVSPNDFPNFLKWMPNVNGVIDFENNKEEGSKLVAEADAIFCLDFNTPSRMGDPLWEVVQKVECPYVMIDHHPYPDDFAQWMLSDTSSCSTAQLIYEFIEMQGDLDMLDVDIAACIYCGIVTDSGSFRFSSVTARTHEIAADLINRGLKHHTVHESLFDVNTLDRLHLLGYAINEKLKVLPNIPVAVISLSTQEMHRFNAQKGYTEGLVNYALSVEGVEMAVFLREDKNMVKLSFRSKGNLAVNEFASEHFNGGGHKYAAGGAIFDKNVDEVLAFLEEKITAYLS